jgi:acetamidase/formamidase
LATHHFVPERYYTAIGTYEPVLTIAPGDTVTTTTVDASGRDAEEKQAAGRPNAQTGPFYIAGAKPGDTVTVRFDRLRPNRRIGYTNTVLAPNVVDPWYVAEFPQGGHWNGEWEVDVEAGTARLLRPATSINDLIFPLRPMLGCFGVAPPDGQAISCATSGPHGGNMDYVGFEVGTTIHFPVFVEGGLLFVGDAHAVQGHGEIVGTGIEISCDVEFTVGLIPGKRIHWPRAETSTHILTAGNARPLDQALQHATTEMTRWLIEDFGFDPVGAHTLLGMCVEYEVGNVFDPAYTMICKLARRWLPDLRLRA